MNQIYKPAKPLPLNLNEVTICLPLSDWTEIQHLLAYHSNLHPTSRAGEAVDGFNRLFTAIQARIIAE